VRTPRQPPRKTASAGIVQLAFAWDPAREARPGPDEESKLDAAPIRAGALAQTLMEEVVEAANLRRALKRVRSNKGSPGVDGMTIQALPAYLRQEWPRLREELVAGTYRPQPVVRAEIPKPSGGVRALGIPTVVDRFIQQAILQVLGPMYDPTFSSSSYGFRPGKSAHQALEAGRHHVASGRTWVVDLDLEKFFDRVNHDVLLGRLAKRIGDPRILRVIRRYLEAGVLADGVVLERYEGTPQGGPLSPLLANILLDELDRELERRGHAFCRYADDVQIYVRSQRAGERVVASVARFLERTLRLQVNHAKSAVAWARERTFLGYRIRGRKRVYLAIAPESVDRAKATIRRITKRNRGVSFERVLRELRTFTDGWVGYFWRAQTPSLFRTLDQWIRWRLRCYQWKLRKTPHRRAQALRAVTPPGTRPATGGGPWRAAGSAAVKAVLSNATLADLGFHSLHDRYHALAAG
jgi:RNA-directed DNA polymerase